MSIARAQELVATAEYAQAESLLLRHLRASPKDPDALHLMCYILAHTGRMDQALFYAQRATAAAPNSSNALANLGNTLLALNREDEALDSLRRAASLDHHPANATHALALALNSTRRYTEARDLCQRALVSNPTYIPFTLDLADALQHLAQADKAVTLLQSLAAQHPHDPLIAGNLAAAMNYAPNLAPSDILRAHTRFGAALAANLPPPNPPPITDADPDRVIRLGIIIPDLTKHSVAYFIRPVLERLDTSRFNLFIYYTGTPKPGHAAAPTAKDAGLAPEWPIATHTARFIAWEPLPRLDTLIRADRLDMLMDLCGMSSQHRLPLMHVKPAPIQLTYAGYPNTTGISSIDYRIVDSHTDPQGSEAFASETLLRLDPCFLCYTPPLDAPDPTGGSAHFTRPGESVSRPVTFGSFNHLPKLNDPLIQLWARILNAVPDSRLILKAQGLHHPDARRELEQRINAAGVASSRLRLLPPTPSRADHLNLYAQIDIALDPFPYHGTTTTCEALHMGVPVLTLSGNTHVSRVGVSLLRSLNLTQLIASNEDEYFRIATSLAHAPDRLHSLRTSLRPTLQSSPLCDEPAFASRFQSLLRTIWQARCR